MWLVGIWFLIFHQNLLDSAESHDLEEENDDDQ